MYYKQPSFIHKVVYTSIIDELLNAATDEHDEAMDKLNKNEEVNSK